MAFECLRERASFSIPDLDGAVRGYELLAISRDRCSLLLQQLAIHFPSGENLTAATPRLCPLNVM